MIINMTTAHTVFSGPILQVKRLPQLADSRNSKVDFLPKKACYSIHRFHDFTSAASNEMNNLLKPAASSLYCLCPTWLNYTNIIHHTVL